MSDQTSLPKTAAIIVGHGSILSDAGAAMMRIAEKLDQQQIVPIVQAGFLNYNEPTFADAVAKAITQNAKTILVLPYFLIAGVFVSNDLQQLVALAQRQYADVNFVVSDVIGTHPAMVELAALRLVEATVANVGQALLFVAHGTPLAAANLPITQMLNQVRRKLGYHHAQVGFLDCNQPDIPAAFDALIATGVTQIDVLPYFLHLGRHVRKDLPVYFDEARKRHEKIAIRIARHLDDEAILARICGERIVETQRGFSYVDRRF